MTGVEIAIILSALAAIFAAIVALSAFLWKVLDHRFNHLEDETVLVLVLLETGAIHQGRHPAPHGVP